MKTKRVVVGLLLCACIFLVLRCTKSPTAGNGSQTPNASVLAMLYNQDGTPAVGVRVFIRPRSTLADTTLGIAKVAADTASTVTDVNGRYAFDTTLDTGTYIIEAASDNNVVFIDSVVVTSKDSTDPLAPDTLKPAGAIKGVIWLSEGGDPRKVFVLAFGIDRFARVNADGSFKFEKLAEGKYDLRLISSLDNYGVMDTVGVQVRSADTTDLDTIRLPFTGIPTPKNVTVSYDTLKQIVTLTWSKVDTALVKGYNVFRRNIDSSFGQNPINGTVLMRDTVYRDSTGTQDRTYEYKVMALDKGDNAGKMSLGQTVVVKSAFLLVDSISLHVSALDGFSIAVSADSQIYVAYRTEAQVSVFSPSGDSINTFGKGQFSRLYGIAVNSKKQVYVVDPDMGLLARFTATGILDTQFTVSTPTAVAVDATDNVYVLYANRQALMVVAADDRTVTTVALYGGNTKFIAARSDTAGVVVGDAAAGTITSLRSDLSAGTVIRITAPFLSEPYWVRAIDRLDHLYVGDYQKQIAVFAADGTLLGRWNPGVYETITLSGARAFILHYAIPYNKVTVYRLPF